MNSTSVAVSCAQPTTIATPELKRIQHEGACLLWFCYFCPDDFWFVMSNTVPCRVVRLQNRLQVRPLRGLKQT